MSQNVLDPDFLGTQVRWGKDGPQIVTHRLSVSVEEGPDRGATCDVEGSRLVIGTTTECDLVLRDPHVSRRHCEIVATDDGYKLRDLGSTNGTMIGAAFVTEAVLLPQAELRVGDTVIHFMPKRRWVTIMDSRASHFGGLFGTSPAMRSVYSMLERIAPSDLTVLLHGETGTGKELAARAVHETSGRTKGPFVVFDCSAASSTLIEAELFGHEKGAFTGADRQRQGVFELASGGTIFLDEIGELPGELQPKLLRVLEQRQVKRVGGDRPFDVDVRVISATHRDLSSGALRGDLFYRLAEVVVELPPLRARLEDIPVLVGRFLEDSAKSGGRVRDVDDSALEWLMRRSWPGNVRELRNVLRRALALARGERLSAGDLDAIQSAQPELGGPQQMAHPSASRPPPAPSSVAPPPMPSGGGVHEGMSLRDAREQWTSPMERLYLERLVQRAGGDLNRAATEAGIHRKSLIRLLRRYGLKAD